MADEELIYGAENTEGIIKTAKAVGSKTRLKILQLLAKKEMDISELAEELDQTEANISAQVKHLKNAKLVDCRYESGKHGVRKLCSTTVKKFIINIA